MIIPLLLPFSLTNCFICHPVLLVYFLFLYKLSILVFTMYICQIYKKEKKKTEILMNKPVCLGLLILELSKILMPEFWYDYVIKKKHGENTKLYYMDTDSFLVYIKTDDTYKNIAEDVETRFDTLNYELDRPLPKGKNKKLIGLTKEELGRKIMATFVGLRAKT